MSKLKTIVFGFMALALTITPVLADEEADIQAEMDALEQMLADLATEIGTITDDAEEEEVVEIEGIPADFAFSATMGQGAEGVGVQYLQILLNADPATQVAESGVGSAGNETTYYGPATSSAVVRFQNKYASEVLTPLGLTGGTGYFGSSSVAKANALISGTAPVAPGDPEEEFSEILEQLTAIAEAVADLSERVANLEDSTADETEGSEEEEEEEEEVVEAEIDVKLSDDSPKENNIVAIKESELTEDKVLAIFDIKVEDGDVELTGAEFTFDGSRNAVARARFFVNEEFVDEFTDTKNDTVELEIDNYEVVAGETAEFKVVVDYHGMDELEWEGATAKVSLDEIEYYDVADDSYGNTWSDGVDSETQSVYSSLLKITLNDQGMDLSDDGATRDGIGNGYIDFTVKALAGDFTPYYLSFINTGDGTLTTSYIEVNGTEYNEGVVLTESVDATSKTLDGTKRLGIQLDGVIELGDGCEITSITGSAQYAEWVMVASDADASCTEISELEVFQVDDWDLLENTNLLSRNINNTTTYVGYEGAGVDSYVVDYTELGGYTYGGEYVMNMNDYAVYENLNDSAAPTNIGEIRHTDYIGYDCVGILGDLEVLLSTDLNPTSSGTTDYIMNTNDNTVWEVTTGDGDTTISEIAPTSYVGYADAKAGSNIVGVKLAGVNGEEDDYFADEYVMDSSTYDVYKVDGSTSGPITDGELTDYVGYEGASIGSLVYIPLFEELSEGETIDISLEGRIEGADDYERLKVAEIGWIESEGNRKTSWDIDWDAIDMLETVRKYINYQPLR